mgnify:CR=1 FL=1
MLVKHATSVLVQAILDCRTGLGMTIRYATARARRAQSSVQIQFPILAFAGVQSVQRAKLDASAFVRMRVPTSATSHVSPELLAIHTFR